MLEPSLIKLQGVVLNPPYKDILVQVFLISFAKYFRKGLSKLTFTCSELTIETPERRVKYFQS